MEAEYNHYLSPNTPVVHNLQGILTERTGTDSVEITVSAALEKIAAAALQPPGCGLRSTPNGAILAAYSSPTYNPNKLSSTDAQAVDDYYTSLDPESATHRS